MSLPMATATTDPAAAAPPTPPVKSGGGLGGMIKIGGLVVLLLVSQVAIFWVFFGGPAPSQTTQAPAAAAEAADKKAVPEVEAPEEFSEVQVSVQPFRCTNSKAAASGGVVHIDFKLVALVPAPQAAKIAEKLKAHESRLRQNVAAVARSLTIEDLADPELSVMKRRIREQINKTLKDSAVQEIIIVDYTSIEQ